MPQVQLREHTDRVWQTLEARVAGKDPDYRDIVLLPLIATVSRQGPGTPWAEAVAGMFDELADKSVQLPGQVCGGLDSVRAPRGQGEASRSRGKGNRARLSHGASRSS